MSHLCRYCKRDLPPSAVRSHTHICTGCADKLPSVRRFVEVCDEFKERINYNHVKLKMKEGNQ